MSSSKEAFGPSTSARWRGGAGGRDLARGPWKCPSCGRGEWFCRIARDGTVWCTNNPVGAFATLRNQIGAVYLHRPEGERLVRAVETARGALAGASAELPPPEDLHAMNCHLLGALGPPPEWVRAIVRDRRRLTDGEILGEGYAYLPRDGRRRLAEGLVRRFGEALAMRLPGMRLKADEATGASWPSLGGAAGLVVPLRTLVDGEARVVALKVRALEADVPKGRRFTFVSSARHGGCAAPVAPHFPRRALELRAQGRRDVILVESEVAATVVTCVTGRPAVAVAGAQNAPRFAAQVAREWGADVVRVCLDNDPSPATRARVAAFARDAVEALRAEGFDGRVLTFPPPAKGPDDHVCALHRPRPTAPTGTDPP